MKVFTQYEKCKTMHFDLFSLGEYFLLFLIVFSNATFSHRLCYVCACVFVRFTGSWSCKLAWCILAKQLSLYLFVLKLQMRLYQFSIFFPPISFGSRPQNSADYMVIFPYQHHMPTTCPFHLNMECKKKQKNNYNTSLYSYIVSMSRVKLLM